MIAVSYGGGTNSTAMLIGLRDHGIIPDVITFADTGGEKPHTYAHIDLMQAWCRDNGFPEIIIVQTVNRDGDSITLEGWCRENNALPSIAYGFKSCSEKHKIRPQNKFMNHFPPAKAAWARGEKITKCVGYDADEGRRAIQIDDPKYNLWYPLIDWDWGRPECIEAIKREGLSQPGKSACFFCPSSSQTEVRWLAEKHPELMDRAIAMEGNAQLTQVKGLGRSYAWKDLIATDDMFPESFIDIACGCYDG